jgi:putative transposase
VPRQPRYFLPNIPQHVVARGVDRQPVFFRAQDYVLYLQALRNAAVDSRCQVHAYVLMTNHVHLLVTPAQERSLPLMIQAMGRTYVQRLNVRYQRTGTLWEGRYKASLVQTELYLLACQRYIELSSYAFHALGKDDPLLTPHDVYLNLHADRDARLRAYRALFSDELSEELLRRLRESTNACTVIGNNRFRKQLATMLGREVPTGKRGRPKRKP